MSLNLLKKKLVLSQTMSCIDQCQKNDKSRERERERERGEKEIDAGEVERLSFIFLRLYSFFETVQLLLT